LIMLKISNGMFEKIVVQNSLQLEQWYCAATK
jgi:hypothetical protein